MDFYEIFRICWVWHKEQSETILGMISLTPWTQGSFFYFLGPCLLATSRNTGWMDIHEIFRIWTQEAIGYTVSRLSRLFHALQTRRGGGLRSRSDFCLNWCHATTTGQIDANVDGFYRNIEKSNHTNRQKYLDILFNTMKCVVFCCNFE